MQPRRSVVPQRLGYRDPLPPDHKAAYPPLPDPSTRGATLTAPPYSHVCAATSGSASLQACSSATKSTQGTKRNSQPMEPGVSNHGPATRMPVGSARWILGSGRPGFKLRLPSLTSFTTQNWSPTLCESHLLSVGLSFIICKRGVSRGLCWMKGECSPLLAEVTSLVTSLSRCIPFKLAFDGHLLLARNRSFLVFPRFSLILTTL